MLIISQYVYTNFHKKLNVNCQFNSRVFIIDICIVWLVYRQSSVKWIVTDVTPVVKIPIDKR